MHRSELMRADIGYTIVYARTGKIADYGYCTCVLHIIMSMSMSIHIKRIGLIFESYSTFLIRVLIGRCSCREIQWLQEAFPATSPRRQFRESSAATDTVVKRQTDKYQRNPAPFPPSSSRPHKVLPVRDIQLPTSKC